MEKNEKNNQVNDSLAASFRQPQNDGSFCDSFIQPQNGFLDSSFIQEEEKKQPVQNQVARPVVNDNIVGAQAPKKQVEEVKAPILSF